MRKCADVITPRGAGKPTVRYQPDPPLSCAAWEDNAFCDQTAHTETLRSGATPDIWQVHLKHGSLAAWVQEKAGQVAKTRTIKALPPRIELSRCPYCQVNLPNLESNTSDLITISDTASHTSLNCRVWGFYVCANCAGVVMSAHYALPVQNGVQLLYGMNSTIYPSTQQVSEDIPLRAKTYLEQAVGSLSQPDAAVMVAASAVDAMLKEIGLKDGSLHARIEKAHEQHLITKGMSEWAHEVRLAANGQRHSDEEFQHATLEDAKHLLEFASALAEFLFVLPAKVNRGRTPKPEPAAPSDPQIRREPPQSIF